MLEYNETLDLLKRAKNNDDFAKERLIEENAPLIKSIIKRYKDKGVEYEDLFQLGSLGFLKAINNFNESFNVKFSTYAVPMIAGEVKRFLRDNGIIKVSRSTKTLNLEITKFISEYNSKNEKSPNVEEIAQKFNITPADVVYAMESSKQPLSLNSIVGEDGESNQMLIEKIESYNMDQSMDMFLIYNVIKTLSKRDKKIILLRFFRDKTQKEIADELGVSQVQVSRLENKIINIIKKKINVV